MVYKLPRGFTDFFSAFVEVLYCTPFILHRTQIVMESLCLALFFLKIAWPLMKNIFYFFCIYDWQKQTKKKTAPWFFRSKRLRMIVYLWWWPRPCLRYVWVLHWLAFKILQAYSLCTCSILPSVLIKCLSKQANCSNWWYSGKQKICIIFRSTEVKRRWKHPSPTFLKAERCLHSRRSVIQICTYTVSSCMPGSNSTTLKVEMMENSECISILIRNH